MYTSTLGLSQGEFTELKMLKDGVMTDVTTLVGGGGTVETATLPLQITGTDIAIDTSGLARNHNRHCQQN